MILKKYFYKNMFDIINIENWDDLKTSTLKKMTSNLGISVKDLIK